MSLSMILLPLVAQVGPFTAPGIRGTPFPEKVERRAKVRSAPAPFVPPPVRAGKAQECVNQVDYDAEAAVDTATAWLAVAKPDERAEAGLCLGMRRVGWRRGTMLKRHFWAGARRRGVTG